MPFANVTIQVVKDAAPAIARWRQDATVGSVMSFSLSSTTGVNSYQWMLWRPEGSAAGGAGIEPISLGTSPSANITIDIRGTYIVWCMINGGAPDATILRSGCAYLEAISDPLGRPLRLIGPFETDEDQADPLIQEETTKMLNRWFRTIAAGGGGGGGTGAPAAILWPTNPYGDASGNLVGNWLPVSAGRHLSYEFLWNGNPTGVISFQISNDGANPFPFPGTFSPPITQPSGGAGSAFIDLIVTDAAYIRPVYTSTSGTGTITGIVMLKLSASGGGADAHDVMARSGDPAPAFLDTKLKAGTNITFTPIVEGGIWKLQISAEGGGGGGGGTLASDYAAGAHGTDQSLTLLNANGGGIKIDGSSPSFTAGANNPNMLVLNGAVGTVTFSRIGGMQTSGYGIGIGTAAIFGNKLKFLNNQIAIGDATTVATGSGCIVIGAVGAGATGINGIAIGGDTGAAGNNSVSVGYGAESLGVSSVAMGTAAHATADSTMAMGQGSTASATNCTATGASASASATGATATGAGATANQNSATATGSGSLASGNSATATGSGASASAASATATGSGSTASAASSTADGAGAIASGISSCAFGAGAIADQSSTATGAGANATSGESGATATGAGSIATAPNATATGENARATWDSSTATGSDTVASALNSTATGYGAQATGTGATADGQGAVASAQQTVAVGSTAQATLQYNTAVGFDAQAITGTSVTALGAGAHATASHSIAVGTGAIVSGGAAIALGASAIVSGLAAIAVGYEAQATATNCMAFGQLVTASLVGQVLFGHTSYCPIVYFQAASALGNSASDKFLFQFASLQVPGEGSPGAALSYDSGGYAWGMTSMLLMCIDPATGSNNCRRVYVSSGPIAPGSNQVLYVNAVGD